MTPTQENIIIFKETCAKARGNYELQRKQAGSDFLVPYHNYDPAFIPPKAQEESYNPNFTSRVQETYNYAFSMEELFFTWRRPLIHHQAHSQ
jgi:hypothetical protein